MPSGAVQIVLMLEIFTRRRPDCSHRRPVPCLRDLLENRGRSVLLGHRPCLLEPLGEDHASGLVALPTLFVQFEHLFGDEVGEGGDNTLGPRTESPPEVSSVPRGTPLPPSRTASA